MMTGESVKDLDRDPDVPPDKGIEIRVVAALAPTLNSDEQTLILFVVDVGDLALPSVLDVVCDHTFKFVPDLSSHPVLDVTACIANLPGRWRSRVGHDVTDPIEPAIHQLGQGGIDEFDPAQITTSGAEHPVIDAVPGTRGLVHARLGDPRVGTEEFPMVITAGITTEQTGYPGFLTRIAAEGNADRLHA